MIKSELIAKISAQKTQFPESKIADCVNYIIELMRDSLTLGQRIEIRGFGSFSLHFRPPRNAHNPKTGERVITQAKHSPHFKPGKGLRERIDASRGKYPIQSE